MNLTNYFKVLLTITAAFILVACNQPSNTNTNTSETSTSTTKPPVQNSDAKPPASTSTNASKAIKDKGKLLQKGSGTEPFWHVEVASKKIIIYSLATMDTLVFDYVKPRNASGRPAGIVDVYELKNEQMEATIVFNGMLSNVKNCYCMDGMSDNKYSHSVVVITPENVLEGCANKIE